jgi:hypothetical protein
MPLRQHLAFLHRRLGRDALAADVLFARGLDGLSNGINDAVAAYRLTGAPPGLAW